MKRASYCLTLLILLAGIPVLSGHGGEPKKVSEIMQQKLKHAQKVLEGIALNDFDQIMDHADGLMQLTKEVEWQVLKTPRY